MRSLIRVTPALLLALVASCESTTTLCCTQGQTGLRVINAFPTAVDVLIDGNVVISGLSAGTIGTTSPTTGTHTLELRANGTTATATKSLTISAGALATIAAVRNSTGTMGTAALDDTGSVVPAGKTKVRVLHLAANAGEIQVYRTQPDYQTPISWQFPFTYQASFDALSAPFLQSDTGTWEVRVWQTPASASGWATAPVKVVFTLGSGEKRTIVVLDKPGGGVMAEVL
jgi:hypothetical protein